MRMNVSTIVVAALAVQACVVSNAGAAGKSSATARVTLADCTRKLDAQGGGWCEMSGATIADVFPKGLNDQVRGWTGPASVLIAWNGAAWDAKRRKWYFHGGGHSDYGGNEVYEFDVDKATFTRLTDPADVPAKTAAVKCPPPVSGPRSSHTYDGFIFSTVTDTAWLFPGVAGYCNGGMASLGGEMWEFNPDATQSRNGIPPLSWRRAPVEMPAELQKGAYPRTAELPDGTIVYWSNHRGGTFNPRTGEWKGIGSRADYGDGNAVYDPVHKVIWESAGAFLRMTPTGMPQKASGSMFGVRPGAGLAVDGAGTVFAWSGGPTVVRYDADKNQWQASLSSTGPDSGTVYSKWVFLPKEGVFMGYAKPTTGVWIYKPPKDGWQTLPERSAQSYIDAAPEGSKVTIPPGLYAAGIQIDKDLAVDLTGVRFDRPVGGKANVVVENPKRHIKVTITGYDMPGAKINGNGASIRADYDYDLTVQHFHVRDSNMGILTGNHGGRLVLEDGLIEEACCGSDLSHGVYMGLGKELVMRHVTVTNLRRLGHLVKSRALSTTIEDCKLVGGEGRYSREIDIPNGGHIVIRRNFIEKGPNTDNADSMAIGAEAGHPEKPGGETLPTSLEYVQNVVVFDRWGAASEPAHDAGPSELGKWRHMPAGTPIDVSGNTFVNMKSWGEFPNFASANRMYPTREAAGLPAHKTAASGTSAPPATAARAN